MTVLQYSTPYYTTQRQHHCTTLHNSYTNKHCIGHTPLHCTTLHYTALRYTTTQHAPHTPQHTIIHNIRLDNTGSRCFHSSACRCCYFHCVILDFLCGSAQTHVLLHNTEQHNRHTVLLLLVVPLHRDCRFGGFTSCMVWHSTHHTYNTKQ